MFKQFKLQLLHTFLLYGSVNIFRRSLAVVHETLLYVISTHSLRSFYRAANGIFGKIGRIASDEVTIQLLKSKCLLLLLIRLRSLQPH